MYWDDRYGTETVSSEVLNRMKQLMMDNNTTASHSFLLDDDSSIPFTPEDVANLMDDKVCGGGRGGVTYTLDDIVLVLHAH